MTTLSKNTVTDLFIPATASSPEVSLRFSDRRLSIKGEAYPENAALFWSPVIQAIHRFMDHVSSGEAVTVDIELTYFNSSSTKMLFTLLDTLNESAAAGTPVLLNWFHDEDDDIIHEFGLELAEDFTSLTFQNHAIQTDG